MWSLLDYFSNEVQFIIVDIGAALTERAPYQFLVDAGRASVIGFEPNVEECERLNREYGEPHRFFPYFIGDGNPAVFHETNWGPTGSLYKPNTPLIEKFQQLAEIATLVATHPVNTTKLDDVVQITDVDFVKIDAQGGELAALTHGSRVLADTLLIQTEVAFVEGYVGQPMFADVDTFLRGAGFQFHAFKTFGGRRFKPPTGNLDIDQSSSQWLWADALYVRDWMALDSLAVAKLQKYAVLAHDFLRAFDLAHIVLQALDKKTGGTLASRYLARLSDEMDGPRMS